MKAKTEMLFFAFFPMAAPLLLLQLCQYLRHPQFGEPLVWGLVWICLAFFHFTLKAAFSMSDAKKQLCALTVTVAHLLAICVFHSLFVVLHLGFDYNKFDVRAFFVVYMALLTAIGMAVLVAWSKYEVVPVRSNRH